MASLRQKPNGRWQVRWRDAQGRAQSGTFPTKAQAKRAADNAEALKRMHRHGFALDARGRSTRAAARLPLGELLSWFERVIVPTKRDRTTLRARIRVWTDELDLEADAYTLEADTVKDVVMRLAGGLHRPERERYARSPQTLLHYVNALSSAFAHYRAHHAEAEPALLNPVATARRQLKRLGIIGTGTERDRRLLPGEEEILLREACAYSAAPSAQADHAAIIRFALATSMREGEIAALTPDDIQLGDFPVARVRHDPSAGRTTKNSRSRSVPLLAGALAELRPRLRGSRSAPLFGIRHARTISQAFGRIVARAGLEDLRFHDLRHEALSRLGALGVFTAQDLQQFSGHRSSKMLDRYVHPTAHEIHRKIARLEEIDEFTRRRREALAAGG